ncbi:MAG TPA: ElyC/SanA/YdcF family protein [Candidatus Xenobia bacterium]|jgi:SanA protein
MRLPRPLNITLGLLGVFALGAAAISSWVWWLGQRFICAADTVPSTQVAIVPGAYVYPDGTLCGMLQDRVRIAVDLYRQRRVTRLLMSGDHGRTDYDEVNAMRRFAEKAGVPPQDIFMDHAGFNTHDTMARARQVFCVQSATVVTQSFHLARAVYLARAQGIDAYGVASDCYDYPHMSYYQCRDAAARCKAFLDIVGNVPPTFLGPPIPITGDGRLTKG